MSEQLLTVVALITLLGSVATLLVLVLTLRSARRTQRASEDRIQLLRDQQARLEYLRKEDRLLAEQVESQRPLTAEEEGQAKRSEGEEL
jgi:cytochrome c-type biogenesis protein CcmH/NrfG